MMLPRPACLLSGDKISWANRAQEAAGPGTAPRRSRFPRASGRSTGCPAAATAGSTMPSTWPRSPRSATGTARAAPTTTRKGRRQDRQRSPARAEAADQRRHLRLPPRRRPARRQRERPGRATGERLWLQRGRLTPRTPALWTSHSRACHSAYDPRERTARSSRAFPPGCHPARAGKRVRDGRSPAAQPRPQGVLDPAAREPKIPATGKRARQQPKAVVQRTPLPTHALTLTLKQRGVLIAGRHRSTLLPGPHRTGFCAGAAAGGVGIRREPDGCSRARDAAYRGHWPASCIPEGFAM
jgi:hypothetical protein